MSNRLGFGAAVVLVFGLWYLGRGPFGFGVAVVLIFLLWYYFFVHEPTPPPSQPAPPPPHIIADDPALVPTGQNHVLNPSFETGNFGPGSETFFNQSGVVDDWIVLQNGGLGRWVASGGSQGSSRYVDLTGGRPPSPPPASSHLYQDHMRPLQSGQRYEVALDLGVGPDNGPLADASGPITVRVRMMRMPELDQTFVHNPAPPSTGVAWLRFRFRFAIPAAYVLPPGNSTIEIVGVNGKRLIGVDNVSVQVLTPI